MLGIGLNQKLIWKPSIMKIRCCLFGISILSQKKCQYFVSSNAFEKKVDHNMDLDLNEPIKPDVSKKTSIILFNKDKISPDKEAGLILGLNNKLYNNLNGKSVSICGPVYKDHSQSFNFSSTVTNNFNLLTHNLSVAIDQVIEWNKIQKDD